MSSFRITIRPAACAHFIVDFQMNDATLLEADRIARLDANRSILRRATLEHKVIAKPLPTAIAATVYAALIAYGGRPSCRRRANGSSQKRDLASASAVCRLRRASVMDRTAPMV